MNRARSWTTCAVLLLAAWCGRAGAQEQTPEQILKAKGLAKAGMAYLLEADVKLQEEMRPLRKMQAQVTEIGRKRTVIERDIQMADSTMAGWDAEFREVNQQLSKTQKDSTYQHNQLASKSNVLLANIRDGERFKQEREAALKKLGDPRDDYVGIVLELSDKLGATQKQYDALVADAQVKEALDRLNQTARPKVKMGPSVAFTAALAFVRKQRELINSQVIRVEVKNGVPHVQATLNGTASQEMVVDSGASLVILTWEVAQQLGMKLGPKDGTIELTIADGKTVKASLMTLQSVRVGQFTAQDVQCAVMPKSAATQDCLLGGTFLRNFIYRMDLAAGELHLSQMNGKPGSPGAGMASTKPAATAPSRRK